MSSPARVEHRGRHGADPSGVGAAPAPPAPRRAARTPTLYKCLDNIHEAVVVASQPIVTIDTLLPTYIVFIH